MSDSARQTGSDLLGERILVLDGAWGTMIQDAGLAPEDYRGERFRRPPARRRGRPRPAQPDPARRRARHPPRLPRRGRRHHDDEHVHGDVDRPGRLRPRGRRARHERRGRAARAAGRRRGRRPLRRRLARPAERDALALPAGRRPRLPRRHVRRRRRRLRRADRGAARGRRRPPARRDDLRHAEREGGDRGGARRGARAAALDLGHDRRPLRPHALRARRSRRSGPRSSTRSRCIVGVNCSLGAKEMRPHVAELARLADTFTSCHPNAGLPNAFGGYDEEPHDTAGLLARVRRGGLRERRRRLLRHDARPHASDRRPRSRGTPRSSVPHAAAPPALQRPRAVRDRPGHRLRDDRRAHERHRLGALPPPDRGGRLTRARSTSRSSRCAAARTSST